MFSPKRASVVIHRLFTSDYALLPASTWVISPHRGQIGIHVIPSREGLALHDSDRVLTLIVHSVAGWVITTLEFR